MASPAKSPDEEDSKSWMEWRVRNVVYIYKVQMLYISNHMYHNYMKCKMIVFSPETYSTNVHVGP